MAINHNPYSNWRKLKADLARMQGRASRAVEVIGDMSVDHFKKSFDDKGFTNVRRGKWRPRRRSAPHPLMVKSGALRNSIVAKRTGKYTVRIRTIGSNPDGTNVNDYAEVHNDGTSRVPQRKFIGRSIALDKKIMNRLRFVFR